MSNVFNISSVKPLEKLCELLGSIDECKRLGFIYEDENNVMELSVSGTGYLLHKAKVSTCTEAEAFAAGYELAHDEVNDWGDIV